VGHAGGYKNLPLLLGALAIEGAHDAQLVRVGSLRRSQWKLARELGIADRITLLPGIDDATLAALFNLCDVLVQPSLAEGFGLPVAEAMASGLPVLTSDGGALPEVASEAGVVVPLEPRGTAARRFADAITGSLAPAAAEVARKRGLIRARDFASEAVVPRLLDVYRQAASVRLQAGDPVDS
jgi:glycosyltransferase involved in cell wall biosynthesis